MSHSQSLTDGEQLGRRETLHLVGMLGTAAVGGLGAVGETGATEQPDVADPEFDPTETQLGRWTCIREQRFDSQAFHGRRRRVDGHPIDANWRAGRGETPPAAVTWSWPEIVRLEDGTVRLRPAEGRPHPDAGARDVQELLGSYDRDDLPLVDSWVSRPQVSFEFPALVDLVDVMYVPLYDSWRYTFVHLTSGQCREYFGTPAHAHQQTATTAASDRDPPVVREHGIDLVVADEDEDPITFVTAQGKEGVEHAVGYPVPEDHDVTEADLEREFDTEFPEAEANSGLLPDGQTVATVVLLKLLKGARLSNPAAFAAEVVVRTTVSFVADYFFGPGQQEQPDQVDEVRWSYVDGEEERPRSHAHHSRVWAVDVPASPEEVGRRVSFDVVDSFELAQRLTSDDKQNQEPWYDPAIETSGTFHVSLPVLNNPGEMSDRVREHYDVRPYCHPDRDECFFKAFGAVPSVDYHRSDAFAERD